VPADEAGPAGDADVHITENRSKSEYPHGGIRTIR